MSAFHTTLEKIRNTISEIAPGQGDSYLKEVSSYLDAFNTADPTFYWTKSEDGGLTCPSFGDGTISILSHVQVLQELETFSKRLVSGMCFHLLMFFLYRVSK